MCHKQRTAGPHAGFENGTMRGHCICGQVHNVNSTHSQMDHDCSGRKLSRSLWLEAGACYSWLEAGTAVVLPALAKLPPSGRLLGPQYQLAISGRCAEHASDMYRSRWVSLGRLESFLTASRKGPCFAGPCEGSVFVFWCWLGPTVCCKR